MARRRELTQPRGRRRRLLPSLQNSSGSGPRFFARRIRARQLQSARTRRGRRKRASKSTPKQSPRPIRRCRPRRRAMRARGARTARIGRASSFRSSRRTASRKPPSPRRRQEERLVRGRLQLRRDGQGSSSRRRSNLRRDSQGAGRARAALLVGRRASARHGRPSDREQRQDGRACRWTYRRTCGSSECRWGTPQKAIRLETSHVGILFNGVFSQPPSRLDWSKQAIRFWQRASTNYAKATTGNVTAHLNVDFKYAKDQKVNRGAIFGALELPEIVNNMKLRSPAGETVVKSLVLDLWVHGATKDAKGKDKEIDKKVGFTVVADPAVNEVQILDSTAEVAGRGSARGARNQGVVASGEGDGGFTRVLASTAPGDRGNCSRAWLGLGLLIVGRASNGAVRGARVNRRALGGRGRFGRNRRRAGKLLAESSARRAASRVAEARRRLAVQAHWARTLGRR